MRIVLSRKGFDAKFGGFPSLILNDSTMISLPIPSKNDKTKYADLHYNDKSYPELISEMSSRTELKSGNKFIPIINANCHLDPDIYRNVITREKEWRGVFGQDGIAQLHLEKEGISTGDLFLFFGWYKKPNTNIHVHAIWGYLKVGKIIKNADEIDNHYPWLKTHPHYRLFKENINNTIYIAADTLNGNMTGYGTFKYNEDLVLTADKMSRSKWKSNYNDLFGNKMTYHSQKSINETFFQSAPIGQEFVIDNDDEVEKWALNLINKHSIK